MIIPNLHCRFDYVVVAGGVDPGSAINTQEAGVSAPGYSSAHGYNGMPVHTIDFKLVDGEMACLAHNHAVSLRIEIDYITGLRRSAGQTFALPDGEQLE